MKTVKAAIHLAVLFLFSFSNLIAQNPTVTSQVGFPVGIKSSTQIVYGNSKYVLLGGYNYTASLNSVYGSLSGTSWDFIATTGLTTAQLNGLAYGAGVFVVVGNSGTIQSSADGITWTTRNSGSTSNLNRVYFLNGKFFAIGYNRTVLTSADGISWTSIAFNTGNATDFFMSLAYGNGVYILAARNDNGANATIYRSTTGAGNSWSSTTNSLAAGEMINRIQFLNNKFFVFCAGNEMYSSTDGLTWTDFSNAVVLTNPNGTTTSWNDYHQIFNGVWDGTRYLFYGSSAFYQGYGSTFSSTDGINFTLLTKTAYIVPQESGIINGTYFICGNEGIVSSADGITYKHPGSSYRDMVKTANKYVAVGMISQDGQIENSTDFSTWTDRRPANTGELFAVAYDGTNVLAGGYKNILRSTDDGDSWTAVYSNDVETFTALAYGNGRFVAGGYSTAGFLRYSTNAGETWTSASTNDYSYLKIKYINNRFFAFAFDNASFESKVLYSTDGITWIDVTPDLGFEVYYFKDVAFDGAKYHLLGIESTSFTPIQFFTVSTATPANSASYGNKAVCNNIPNGVVLGGVYDEGVLDYANGKFTGAVIDVSTGQDYIITSANGNSWTAIAQNSYSSITASAVSGNTVRMLGRGNAFFTLNYGQVLPLSLLKFNGRIVQGQTQLAWTTASEQNTKQFTLQHSTNGTSWSNIGTVAAAGNSTRNQTYQFVHPHPVKGQNFYRLLMQDVDGKATQSGVVTLSHGGRERISSYPNPVTDKLVINTESSLPGRIVLYNEVGQAVKTATVEGNSTILHVSNLPDGVYHAEITQGQQVQKITIIKN